MTWKRTRPLTPAMFDAKDFWSKVDKSGDGCWLYTAYIEKRTGYGIYCHNRRQYKAHRVAYLLHHGSLRTDRMVCHKCDVPTCVRPDHLFQGTATDNAADRNSKHRYASGERAGHATWTADKAISMAVQFILLIKNDRQLSKEFSTPASRVTAIASGRQWAHLTRDFGPIPRIVVALTPSIAEVTAAAKELAAVVAPHIPFAELPARTLRKAKDAAFVLLAAGAFRLRFAEELDRQRPLIDERHRIVKWRRERMCVA